MTTPSHVHPSQGFPAQLPAGLRLVFLDSAGSFPAVAIDTPACRALVSLQGAQLLRMETANGTPLTWLSPGAQFVPGRAVRGGIPLCFPWFGAHADNAALPAHGFARNRDWQLVAATAGQGRDADADADGTVHLAFELHDDDATRALWPHAFTARIDHVLGSSIVTTLTVSNTGPGDLAFGFALHNYFQVSDIAQVRIEGLEGVGFLDKLTGSGELQREESAVVMTRETDRVYCDAPGNYRLVDAARGVTLAITAPACRSAVVWNPWQEKSARLGDVPGDAWREMVCVECGQVGAQDVHLRAGETCSFRQSITHLP